MPTYSRYIHTLELMCVCVCDTLWEIVARRLKRLSNIWAWVVNECTECAWICKCDSLGAFSACAAHTWALADRALVQVVKFNYVSLFGACRRTHVCLTFLVVYFQTFGRLFDSRGRRTWCAWLNAIVCLNSPHVYVWVSAPAQGRLRGVTVFIYLLYKSGNQFTVQEFC